MSADVLLLSKYSEDLASLVIPARGKIDLVTRIAYTAPTPKGGLTGIAYPADVSATTLGASVSMAASTDFTVAITVDKQRVGSANGGVFRTGTGADNFIIFMIGGTDNRPWVRLAGTDVLKALSGPQLPTNRPYTVVTSVKSGKFARVAWDGAVKHSVTFATNTGAGGFTIVGSQGGEYIGNYSLFAYWNRYIDPAELCRAIERNPQPIIWVGLAGSSAADLAGQAAGQVAASGELTTQIPLDGAATDVATATGSLTTQIPLAGAAASVAVANGVLTATIKLSGAALAQVVASASLAGGAAALSGSATESATATGALTTQITLSGPAVAQALATAGLTTVPSGLAGSAAANASSSGALFTGIPLVGQASALAVSAGGLTTGIPISGAAVAVSNATGALTISSGFSAAALMQAAASGTLSTQVRLNAAAVAQALATGNLNSGAWVPVADPRYTVSMLAPDRTLTAAERNWQAVIQ